MENPSPSGQPFQPGHPHEVHIVSDRPRRKAAYTTCLGIPLSVETHPPRSPKDAPHTVPVSLKPARHALMNGSEVPASGHVRHEESAAYYDICGTTFVPSAARDRDEAMPQTTRLESAFSNLDVIVRGASRDSEEDDSFHNGDALTTADMVRTGVIDAREVFLEDDDDENTGDGRGSGRGVPYLSPTEQRSFDEYSGGPSTPEHRQLPPVGAIQNGMYFVEDDDDDEDDDSGEEGPPMQQRTGVCGTKSYDGSTCSKSPAGPPPERVGGTRDGVMPSTPSAPPTSATAKLGIPMVSAEVLGHPSKLIGQGGLRGSSVYYLDRDHFEQVEEANNTLPISTGSVGIITSGQAILDAMTADAIAYKLYRQPISVYELEFIQVALESANLRNHILSPKNADTNAKNGTFPRCKSSVVALDGVGRSHGSSPSPPMSPSDAKMAYAAHHLVFPGAVVVLDGEKRGLLMPLYDFSLKEFLVKITSQDTVRSNGRGRSSSSGNECSAGALLSDVRYGPVTDVNVVTAIAFQVLQGIKLLNYHMPHKTGEGENDCLSSSGFTHNDLHMDNILLSRRGRVALCDFELVGHLPLPGQEVARRRHMNIVSSRLPPYCRRTPHVDRHETHDTWAFGLFVIALLTGVDPLFSNEQLMDDFGEGPLWMSWREAATHPIQPAVLDWEANIGEHVRQLLHQTDPSGSLLDEAAPLLRVCARCLSNRRDAITVDVRDLLLDDVFAKYCRAPQQAEAVVQRWVAASM